MSNSSQTVLEATFANVRGDATHVGPFKRLIFDGEDLHDEDGRLVARHTLHQWELPNGVRYSRMDCYIPCNVSFQSPRAADAKTRDIGPFSTLSAVDGVVYGDQRILAFCDSQLGDWYSFDFGQHYKCLVVVPNTGSRP